MKVLVLKFRNIGDVLLTTPLLSNLKLHYPQASIDVAVNKGTEAMLSLNPNVNQIFVYDRNFVKSLPLLKRTLKEIAFILSFRKRQYDMVINLTEGDRGAQIALFSKALIRIGYLNKNWILKNAFTHHLPKQIFRHTIETNLDPLRLLDISIASKRVEIHCAEADENFVTQELISVNQELLTNGFIHIHPVSRWLFKCISDQTMAKIIDYCETELQKSVVITAAPIQAEIDKVNSIVGFCKSSPANLSGKLTLKQTAALNKKATMFIGVDTAIMHMSAANDVPVLAFFGPSGADHWGPWDNDMMESAYTSRNGVQTMGGHTVISESRACQPCGKDGCNGSKVSDCLMFTKIDTIKENIVRILNNEKN